MGVSLDKLRKKKEEADSKQGRSDFWTVPEGENLIYVCPPLPGDDLMFVESANHYDAGPDKKSCTCLDEERNPVLKDPRVRKMLAAKGKNIGKGCAACRLLDEGAQVAREASSRYFFNIIPLKYRKTVTKKWREHDDADELKILGCGYTIWSGITDVFINNGDISDPNKAVLVVLSREGKGMTTKYTLSADAESVRAGGVSLSKKLKAMVKNQVAEGENGDLYRVVAGITKSSDEVEALVTGVKLEDIEGGDDDGDSDKKPECFGLDYEADEQECKDCPHNDECEKECAPPGAADPEPPSKPKPVDDDDEPEGDDDDDDDDDGGDELSIGEQVKVKDCVEGELYSEDGDEDDIVPMTFKGISKKGRKVFGFFEDEGGERLRLKGADKVFEVTGETLDGDDDDDDDDEDEDMKALDDAIEKRKGKGKAKGKKRTKK